MRSSTIILAVLCVTVVNCHDFISHTLDLTADVNAAPNYKESEDVIKARFNVWFDDPDHTTEWLDGDHQSSMGEFENVQKWMTNTYYKESATSCEVWCPKPLALRWDWVCRDGAELDTEAYNAAEKCVVLKGEKMMNEDRDGKSMSWRGFNCYNYVQKESDCTDAECDALKLFDGIAKDDMGKRGSMQCDICPSVKVQFLCEDPKPKAGEPCPAWEAKRNLQRDLSEVEYQLEKKQDELLQEQHSLNIRQREMKQRKLQEKKGNTANAKLISLLKKYLNN